MCGKYNLIKFANSLIMLRANIVKIAFKNCSNFHTQHNNEKICKLFKAIFSAHYNIFKPNFRILLLLRFTSIDNPEIQTFSAYNSYCDISWQQIWKGGRFGPLINKIVLTFDVSCFLEIIELSTLFSVLWEQYKRS
jgi:hypothetical protein